MPIETFIALLSLSAALVAGKREEDNFHTGNVNEGPFSDADRFWAEMDAETEIVEVPEPPATGPFSSIDSAQKARDMKEMSDEVACEVVKTRKDGGGFDYWVIYAD